MDGLLNGKNEAPTQGVFSAAQEARIREIVAEVFDRKKDMESEMERMCVESLLRATSTTSADAQEIAESMGCSYAHAEVIKSLNVAQPLLP